MILFFRVLLLKVGGIMSLNVRKIQTYPVFIKTVQNEYINTSNIARIRPLNNDTYIAEIVEGNNFVSTHSINKKEAGKIIDCNA